MKKKIIIACSFISLLLAFYCGKIEIKNLNQIIDAVCDPTLYVSPEGDPWTYILESKRHEEQFKIWREDCVGTGIGQTWHYEWTDCCIAVNNKKKKCFPYEDGMNRNNMCADFNRGIYSYSRRCLK